MITTMIGTCKYDYNTTQNTNTNNFYAEKLYWKYDQYDSVGNNKVMKIYRRMWLLTSYKAHLFTATLPSFIFLGAVEWQKDDLLAVLCRRQLEAEVMTLQFDFLHRTFDQLKHSRILLLGLIYRPVLSQSPAAYLYHAGMATVVWW